MSDRETATVDVSKGEARVLIAALADAEATAGGERATRARNLQSHLAAEFGFDEYGGRERGEMAGDGWFFEEWFDDGVLDTGDTEAVEFARTEAEVATDALADFELGRDSENAGVAADLRERLADAFGDGAGD